MKHHDLVRTAMTLDDGLDDIKRARIWSRLEDQLEQPAAPRARWPIMLGVSAVAAIAVLALVRMGGNATDDNARVLAIPTDTTVTANLGPFTRAALVGPAELELVGTPGEATTVRLRCGTLLADFTGGPGRSLRVEAPGATVEIVGTLFAVEARDGGSCTSVAHGRVRVTTAAGDLFVGAGERYCTSGPAQPQPIDETVKRTLELHGSVLTAKAESPPSPAIAAAPPGIAAAPGGIAAAPTPVGAPQRAAPTEPRVATSTSTSRAPAPTPRVSSSSTAVAASPPPAITALAPSAPEPVAETVVAPAPPVAVKPTPTPAPPTTADDLYRSAEAALATGDLAAADRMLDRLLVAFPSSSLVDQALYERARIAYQQRAWATARRHLDRLAALPRTTLAEPGNYLACRIAVETKDGGAVPCLVDYRKAFPSSPHDLEALALVVKLTHASRGCAGVAAEIDELVRRHPSSKYAAAWRARCPERP